MNTIKHNFDSILATVCFTAGVILLILDAFKFRFSQPEHEQAEVTTPGFVEVSKDGMDDLREAIRRFHGGMEESTWRFRDGLAQGQVKINDESDTLYAFKEYERLANAALRFMSEHDRAR